MAHIVSKIEVAQGRAQEKPRQRFHPPHRRQFWLAELEKFSGGGSGGPSLTNLPTVRVPMAEKDRRVREVGWAAATESRSWRLLDALFAADPLLRLVKS